LPDEEQAMTDHRRKFVLVIGTGWTNAAKRRVARMIGTTLADAGFGLIAGNSTGIDHWVADSFCAALKLRDEAPQGAFWQISLGWNRLFERGGLPLPGYAADEECIVAVDDVEAWKREAIARCDAAVMVGGGRGALDIARRIIDQGKPVFPLPFMGGLTGNSDFVFQEILKTWEGHQVPGVSRAQFLQLAQPWLSDADREAEQVVREITENWDGHPVPGVKRGQFLQLGEPWVSGTGQLRNLLCGTLAETPDIFISYRRSDAPAAAGRIDNDLSEHFGGRRVFLDISDIAPGHPWDDSIDEALQASQAGVVVIGRSWMLAGSDGHTPRLHEAKDVVCKEIADMIRQGKAIFPLLVEGARLPEAAELPEELHALLRFQATTIDNAHWGATMQLLIREIEAVIRHQRKAGGKRAGRSSESNVQA
jgi:predicted Rossmann-fold nucleotide-binding protein